MFKLLLLSLVIAPVLLGMQAAANRKVRTGFLTLLALVFTYDVLYLVMLYYLRRRWVG